MMKLFYKIVDRWHCYDMTGNIEYLDDTKFGDETIHISNGIMDAWAIKVGLGYYFHNYDEPAMIFQGGIAFAIYGNFFIIEDMPVNDETKVLWKLKYGHLYTDGIQYYFGSPEY